MLLFVKVCTQPYTDLFQTEIQLVQGLGVSPERIIYANPCKQVSQIKYAASSGVQMMTFDSEIELMKVVRAHPKATLV